MAANIRRSIFGLWFPPLLLTIALVPLGSRTPGAFHTVLILVSAAFLARIATDWRAGTTDRWPGYEWDVRTGALLFVFPTIVLVQLAAQLTVGFSDGATIKIVESAMLLTALSCFFVLVSDAAAEARSFRFLLASLAVIGTLEASYGLLNLLSGNERLLFYERWIHEDSATGTLVSRNHFAFLLELLLPVSAAFGVVFVTPGQAARGRGHHETTGRSLVVGTGVLTMLLALVFSRSRMGMISLSVATLLIFAVSALLRPDRATSRGENRVGVVLVGATTVAVAIVIGVDPVLDRMFNLGEDLEQGRLPIWQAALRMIGDSPVFGHGWGTFGQLLPGYRLEPTPIWYAHAHCDYLEVVAEAGLPGLAATASLLTVFARRLVRTLRDPLSETQRRVVCWLAISITAALLHSATDSGLRVRGVAFTFVCIVALFANVTADPRLAGEADSQARQRRGRRR